MERLQEKQPLDESLSICSNHSFGTFRPSAERRRLTKACMSFSPLTEQQANSSVNCQVTWTPPAVLPEQLNIEYVQSRALRPNLGMPVADRPRGWHGPDQPASRAPCGLRVPNLDLQAPGFDDHLC